MSSMGIETVVGQNNLQNDAMCNVCEMSVVWMRSKLAQNQTQENILNYVNEV